MQPSSCGGHGGVADEGRGLADGVSVIKLVNLAKIKVVKKQTAVLVDKMAMMNATL